MQWLGWLLFLIWIIQGFRLIRFLKSRRLECLVNMAGESHPLPKVSLIIPARNEEQDIADCLESLLLLEYPDFEIIVINDRSTDSTQSIINDLSRGDSRIRPLTIDSLPEGWLGKNHALHRGSQIARGEFLLFADADVIFEEQALNLSMRYTLSEEIDNLVLIPRGLSRTYLEKSFKGFILFGFLLFVQADRIRSDSRDIYVGMGNFNLIRRSAYEAVGGHESLKLEVLDDLMLGKIIKQGGYSQDLLLGLESLSLRWYDGVQATIKGLEKNMFASLDFSLAKTGGVTLFFFLLYLLPYIAVTGFEVELTTGYWAGLAVMHGVFGLFGSLTGMGWAITFALPVCAFLEIITIWNSAFKTLKAGGIRWRDSFYSIEKLKKKT